LGMLNFYRRSLPNAASLQAPLHDALSGPRVKGSHPITWTAVLDKALKSANPASHRPLSWHTRT
jgi:hypothetical protein